MSSRDEYAPSEGVVRAIVEDAVLSLMADVAAEFKLDPHRLRVSVMVGEEITQTLDLGERPAKATKKAALAMGQLTVRKTFRPDRSRFFFECVYPSGLPTDFSGFYCGGDISTDADTVTVRRKHHTLRHNVYEFEGWV